MARGAGELMKVVSRIIKRRHFGLVWIARVTREDISGVGVARMAT